MEVINSIGFETHGLNGPPVMVKFTGLKRKSANSKTGEMVQNYILPIAWMEQRRIGDDKPVCGDCIHSFEKNGDCYLAKGYPKTGLISTLKSMPTIAVSSPAHFSPLIKHLHGKSVRFGSYGEPVLIGAKIVRMIASNAKSWTGYTHRWKEEKYQWAKEFFMASADSEEDVSMATAMGWRTFRVRDKHERILKNEITCPASKEAGRVATCKTCMLCQGASKGAKNIVIIKH